MSRARPAAQERFAAKLLFQYRLENSASGGFRTVEERIVLFFEKNANAAYAAAQHRGQSANHSYLNDGGVRVHFEFVGITDLMSLGCEADEDEVWYEIRRMKDPMQRQEALIPERHLLDAFRFDPDLD